MRRQITFQHGIGSDSLRGTISIHHRRRDRSLCLPGHAKGGIIDTVTARALQSFLRFDRRGSTLARNPERCGPILSDTMSERVNRMETCKCRGVPTGDEVILLLECLECDGGMVKCAHCRKPEWWSNDKRRLALNAAESHRWQTGHSRVVARGFGPGYEGQIVMEVGDE